MEPVFHFIINLCRNQDSLLVFNSGVGFMTSQGVPLKGIAQIWQKNLSVLFDCCFMVPVATCLPSDAPISASDTKT